VAEEQPEAASGSGFITMAAANTRNETYIAARDIRMASSSRGVQAAAILMSEADRSLDLHNVWFHKDLPPILWWRWGPQLLVPSFIYPSDNANLKPQAQFFLL
jgi:hypothetical protein